MIVPIPIGQTHHAAVGTTVLKGVRCEKCTTEYLYRLSRVGKGSGVNPLFLDEAGATREALEDANRNLRHELEFAVDPVPCPECGHYQEAVHFSCPRAESKSTPEPVPAGDDTVNGTPRTPCDPQS